MFKKTALIAGIGLALSATAQADYRWELGAGYADGSSDSKFKSDAGGSTSNNNSVDVWDVSGTWYLETVDTSKGPLGEAAFLDHASSLGVFYTDGTVDISDQDNPDGDTYGANFRYVAEGPGWKLSGVIVDLGYQRSEPGDAEIDTYDVGVGAYVTQNTTVVFNYENIDLNKGGDTDGYNVTIEHFFPFTSGGLKVSANGGKVVVKEQDDVDEWGLGGTWYLGNHWGISADYENTDWSGYEVDAWSAGVQWFITENFAVDLAYSETDPDDIRISGGKLETSYDEVSLSALVRF